MWRADRAIGGPPQESGDDRPDHEHAARVDGHAPQDSRAELSTDVLGQPDQSHAPAMQQPQPERDRHAEAELTTQLRGDVAEVRAAEGEGWQGEQEPEDRPQEEHDDSLPPPPRHCREVRSHRRSVRASRRGRDQRSALSVVHVSSTSGT